MWDQNANSFCSVIWNQQEKNLNFNPVNALDQQKNTQFVFLNRPDDKKEHIRDFQMTVLQFNWVFSSPIHTSKHN